MLRSIILLILANSIILTGIPALRRTTRDEPDYDKLMRFRIEILDERGVAFEYEGEMNVDVALDKTQDCVVRHRHAGH